MKIAVYTLPYEISFEAEKINDLFKAGLEELHIRKPRYTKKQYVALIESIAVEHRSKIVLHEYYNLAAKYEVKGIHVNAKYFKGVLGWVRTLFTDFNKTRVSTTINELEELKKVHEKFDVIFVGPLYRKYSEGNVKSNFDTFEVKNAIHHFSKKTFALGGINLKNRSRIENMGFAGYILQSCIWKSDNVLNSFNAFQMNQQQLSTESGRVKIA